MSDIENYNLKSNGGTAVAFYRMSNGLSAVFFKAAKGIGRVVKHTVGVITGRNRLESALGRELSRPEKRVRQDIGAVGLALTGLTCLFAGLNHLYQHPQPVFSFLAVGLGFSTLFSLRAHALYKTGEALEAEAAGREQNPPAPN